MLRYIAPHKLLLFSVIIWLAFYISIPTTYINISPSFFPVLLLISYILAFLFGMLIIKGKKELIKKSINQRDRFIANTSIIIGTIGTVLKFYQRFIQQGYLFTTDYTKLRIELMANELNSGALGLVTALLAPFGLLSFLMILYYRKHYSKWLFLYAFLIGMYPIFESLFTQGRIIIVMVLAMIITVLLFQVNNFSEIFKNKIKITVFKYHLFSMPKKIASKKVIIPSLILGVLFFIFSVRVVKARLDLFNYKNVIPIWERQQEMRLDEDFKKKVLSSDDVNLEIAKYSLKHYFVHGVFEYIRLVNHVSRPLGTYYGEYEFNPYFKFFRLLGVKQKTFAQLDEIIPKKRVYTTFWGPFYLDFGVFGILIAFVFGAILKSIYIKARKGYLPYILFYSYFSFVILGSMFLNLMIGSSIYIFNALIVVVFLYSFIPQKLLAKIYKK
jgi:hypothetical protein